jgi:hypothetical protein
MIRVIIRVTAQVKIDCCRNLSAFLVIAPPRKPRLATCHDCGLSRHRSQAVQLTAHRGRHSNWVRARPPLRAVTLATLTHMFDNQSHMKHPTPDWDIVSHAKLEGHDITWTDGITINNYGNTGTHSRHRSTIATCATHTYDVSGCLAAIGRRWASVFGRYVLTSTASGRPGENRDGVR